MLENSFLYHFGLSYSKHGLLLEVRIMCWKMGSTYDSGGDLEHKIMMLTLRSRGAKINNSQIKINV